MAKSRWADAEEDAAVEARLKQEKEEKKRRKAEKAQRLDAEKQAAAAAAAAAAQQESEDDDRPSKRRRKQTPPPADDGEPAELLRFKAGTWGPSNSIDDFDKLNDIEEGTYGFVARASSRKTGKVVALKRLKFDPADRSGLPVTGLREIQILQSCRHRNIVGLEEVVVGNDTSSMTKYVLPLLVSHPAL